ncbi:MarR family winged helix-turn-helix transcriptional regulator [Glycomyces sp. NPDC047010]|uniref:MarR family winged helix-turn-helix transcriptional regulator n=1 Tax=Glycomyces sp. NPDC047010 TaxID=3155023 RepID=UPI003410FD4F
MFVDDADIALFFAGWRGFTAAADETLRAEGLGRTDHRVLYVVVRRPGIGVTELAAALGITRQALHRPLSALRRRGLVRADVPARSGRERALAATAAGRDLERRATGPQLDHIAQVLAAAGPEAMDGWRAVMRGFAAAAVEGLPDAVADLLEPEGPHDDSADLR